MDRAVGGQVVASNTPDLSFTHLVIASEDSARVSHRVLQHSLYQRLYDAQSASLYSCRS